jgi:hypothetical protein
MVSFAARERYLLGLNLLGGDFRNRIVDAMAFRNR